MKPILTIALLLFALPVGAQSGRFTGLTENSAGVYISPPAKPATVLSAQPRQIAPGVFGCNSPLKLYVGRYSYAKGIWSVNWTLDPVQTRDHPFHGEERQGTRHMCKVSQPAKGAK